MLSILMNEITIRRESSKDSFFINTVRRKLVEIYDIHHIFNLKRTDSTDIPFYLFDIRECEYRKDKFLYYSRILNYRVIGLLYKNDTQDYSADMISCSQCFQKVETVNKCNSCGTVFSDYEYPYFMNVNQIVGSSHYSRLKEKFNLGLDAINIAPEFGLLETQTYLDEIKDSKTLGRFWQICYNSKKSF